MCHLATQPAADTGLDDGGDRIGAQRIGRRLDGERRTAGEADAGVVAGAYLAVDAVARAGDAFATLELFGVLGADAPLPRQHAFAVGDDDLEPALGGLHRLLQRRHHLRDAIGAHGAHPFHAHRTQGLLDIHARRGAGAARLRRRHVLLAGRRRVAVLHDDQNAVAFVEQVGGDAGDEAVVPETAIAHHRDRALLHVGADSGGAGERHAVAENGVAHRERRKGRERMAADVGGDMRRTELALHQLERGEHRPLRAAGAESRWTRRKGPKRGGSFRLVREQAARLLGDGIDVEARGSCRLQEGGKPVEQHVGGVFACLRQRSLAVDLGLNVGAAQLDVHRLLDVVREAFLDDEHGAFGCAERGDFLGHQRVDDVEHEHWHARGAEHVGKAHALQRAQHAGGETAHDDDADVGEIAVHRLVQFLLADEGARGRQSLFDLQALLREDHRRMREPSIFEFRRPRQLVEP